MVSPPTWGPTVSREAAQHCIFVPLWRAQQMLARNESSCGRSWSSRRTVRLYFLPPASPETGWPPDLQIFAQGQWLASDVVEHTFDRTCGRGDSTDVFGFPSPTLYFGLL